MAAKRQEVKAGQGEVVNAQLAQHATYRSQWPVVLETVPRVEARTDAALSLGRHKKILLRNVDLCHLDFGRAPAEAWVTDELLARLFLRRASAK